MGFFGEKIDRTEKVIIEKQDGTTGKQVASRIKAEQIAKRKITQQNLYRKYRGQGMGILKARKKAKAKASEIMLNQIRHKKHHKKRHHRK